MSKDNEELEVIIIGAGLSGLGAAKELYQKGTTNFRILEGRETFGGRCRTQVLNDGKTLAEFGAQWIHGAKPKNPIYKLALEQGLELNRSAYESSTLYQTLADGTCRTVSQEEYQRMYTALMEGKKGFYAYQEYRQDEDDCDVSMRQCADDYLEKINATPEQRLWMDYILDMEISQEYCGALEDISMYWWDMDEDISGGDAEIKVGFQGLLQKFMKGMEHLIQYETKVTKIDWSQPDRVVVYYTKNGQKHTITAKKVVITVPIGVLQAKCIEFQPPLPKTKQRAIDGIGFGLMNKCIFLWDEADVEHLPWPQDKEWIERIAAPGAQQGLWTEFYYAKPVTGRPTLCAFTVGNVARQVEQWSEQKIRDSAMKALQEQFAGHTIPEPLQVVVTKWGQDEFTKGSYSFNKFGGNHSDRKKLAKPVDEKLYFAGEACHLEYFGTTHGALLSGIKAAKQIQKHSGKGSLASKAKIVAQKMFRGKKSIATTKTVVLEGPMAAA